jgi:hypothetical protein
MVDNLGDPVLRVSLNPIVMTYCERNSTLAGDVLMVQTCSYD